MTDQTIPPEVQRKDVQERVQNAVDLAEGFEQYAVSTDVEYTAGAEDLRAVKAQIKAITDKRLEITRPMDAAKKSVMAFFAEPLDRLTKAESTIKRGLLAYKQEQDRKAAEERRKAAERQQREEERLRRQAEEAREKGKEARAEILEERAAVRSMAPAETKTAAAPKVEGVSTRKVWRFDITDPAAVPEQYKIIDERKIGGVVRALKADANIPGVRVYSEDTMAARRG